MKKLAFLRPSLLLLYAVIVSCAPLSLPSKAPEIAPSASVAGAPEQEAAVTRAARLHQEAAEFYERGSYLQAATLAEEAVKIREHLLGPTHPDVAATLNILGQSLHQLAQIPQARAVHERALRIREQAYGGAHPSVAESLTNLARVLTSSGDFSGARRLLERALQIREARLGQNHPDVAVTLMYLAMVRGLQMNLEDALKHQARAVQIFDQATGARIADHAMALASYGTILGRTGDFARARPLIERALQMQEQALGPSHPDVARTLDSLADLVAKMGDWRDALPLAERALRIREASYGPDHVEVAASLNTVGRLQWHRGDLTTAVRQFQQALQIVEKSVGPMHPVVAANLLDLGEVRRQMGDLATARKMFERAIAIQEHVYGGAHPDLAVSLSRLARVQGQLGEQDKAKTVLRKALEIREQVLGPAHPDVALSLHDLAKLYQASNDLTEARSLYERGRQIYLTMGHVNEDLDEVTMAKLSRRGMSLLRDYALLLATMAGQAKGDRTAHSAAYDGFIVAEQARGWSVQVALAKAVARHASGEGEELQLARAVEDLRRRRQALWTQLNEIYGSAVERRNPQEVAEVKDKLQQIQRSLELQLKQLEVAFPRYADLALPKPADIRTVRDKLRPHEALVSYFTLEDRLQIWLVQNGREPLYRDVVMPKSKLIALVDRLRTSLTPQSGSSILPAVDVESAFELHRILIEPLKPGLANIKDLLLVPDEVLLPLPFAVLLTDKDGDVFLHLAEAYRSHQQLLPQQMIHHNYASLSWLAKSYTLTILPSSSALRLLRQQRRLAPGATEAFIGFGDPVLQGTGSTRGGTMMAGHGAQIDLERLRSLNRLPGTRLELITIAHALGVDPSDHLYLDQQATETQVRRLNASGQLGKAKVLAFSTHGLLAGDLQGLAQPGLVLTLPTVPSDDDDGILSLEDVLQLKLTHTDWVILSACNTAAGDGSGEALSGLARAFFFAGAKALLVSYWSVDDAATQALMTETFTRYGRDRRLPATEALQGGMQGVIAQAETGGHGYFAHPYAWAGFFLVGEAGQRQPE